MYTSVPLAQRDIFNKMIHGRILSWSPDTAGRVLEACVGRCLERPSRQQQSAVPCDVSLPLQPQNSSLDGKQFISGNCFVFFTGKVKMNYKCYVCFYLQMINWLIVAFLNCHDSLMLMTWHANHMYHGTQVTVSNLISWLGTKRWWFKAFISMPNVGVGWVELDVRKLTEGLVVCFVCFFLPNHRAYGTFQLIVCTCAPCIGSMES